VKHDHKKDETPKGALSDKTKGLIVGAASTLSVVGLIYAIMQEEKPKSKAHTPKPAKPTPADGEPAVEEAEASVTETPTDEGGIQITTVLKDVSTVGMAARGIAALEPAAEALIALL